MLPPSGLVCVQSSTRVGVRMASWSHLLRSYQMQVSAVDPTCTLYGSLPVTHLHVWRLRSAACAWLWLSAAVGLGCCRSGWWCLCMHTCTDSVVGLGLSGASCIGCKSSCLSCLLLSHCHAALPAEALLVWGHLCKSAGLGCSWGGGRPDCVGTLSAALGRCQAGRQDKLWCWACWCVCVCIWVVIAWHQDLCSC